MLENGAWFRSFRVGVLLDEVKLLLSKWSIALFGLLWILVLIELWKPLLDLDDTSFRSSVVRFVLGWVPGASEFWYLYRMLHWMTMLAVVLAHCCIFLVEFHRPSFIAYAILAQSIKGFMLKHWLFCVNAVGSLASSNSKAPAHG